ncbi:MAG: ATP-binding protein [Verrucomicrobiales bacterium]|nr:ATP-binding protein [Verrucomicrobiales bacterium]
MAYSMNPDSRSASPLRGARLRRLGIDEVWVQGELSSRLFLTLRWIALIGQSITLLVAEQLGVLIPWEKCLAVLAFTLGTNALMEWWRLAGRGQLGGAIFHMALWDLLSLTILLHATGGLENPFAIFYLVQLTVVTVALRYEGIAGLTFCALIACGFLWYYHHPLTLENGEPLNQKIIALGRLIALALSGMIILTLLVAVRRQSSTLRKEREKLRGELESQDRFLSIATLATGFAHELATPLGTISITASEMAGREGPESLSALIQKEAERCETVINRLREIGHEATDGAAPDVPVATLVKDTLNQLPTSQKSRLKVSGKTAMTESVRSAGVLEALLVLLRNALQSSPPSETVELNISAGIRTVEFEILDRGPGFDDHTIHHWGEPFFTTREEGLGLGLFFVRRLVSTRGGRIEINNRAEGGARVFLSLPFSETSPASPSGTTT